MEIFNLKRKSICLLLILSIALQSCSVYKSKSVTFDEAIAKNNKVKVTKEDGSTDAFDKIEKVDTVYYGLLKTNEGYTRTPLKENDYVKVQPKNKPVSALATVGVIVVPIFAILGLLQIIDINGG